MSSPLRLDLINQCLRRGAQPVPLTPKAFTVLRYLMDHGGQLVTKEELLNAAWPEVYVSDAALKVCIRRLRQTLGDHFRTPQFIETIPWRGYRFIGAIPLLDAAPQPQHAANHGQHPPVASQNRQRQRAPRPSARMMAEQRSYQPASASPTLSLLPSPPPTTHFVGRTVVLQKIHQWLDSVLHGERRTIFISGETGIGKTAFLETFLDSLKTNAPYWIARGQCIEQYGTGEPYLPVLDALNRLCRQPDHEHLVATLRRHAPTWLTQMPSIVTQAERKRLHREGHGVPQDHMLREMAETIETLSIERPFLLVLEDVHWSDYATLDLLALLARRREAARVFVITTYRPYETNSSTHPLKLLKHELVAHGQGGELALDFLSQAEVSEYLALRFPHSEFASALAHVIHQRSEGNPLFMVNMTEYLIGHGILRQEEGQWNLREEPHHIAMGVPTNLQEMIEAQIDRLNQEQQHLLEVASVAGRQFSAAVLAVGLTQDVVTVEDHCAQLVRHTHFLQPCGESTWPDGTFSTQYRFVHSFYQQVLYDRIPSGRRAALHHRIGQQLELAYGPQVNHVATELAMHFERGRDYRRALQYRRTAVEQALQRYAYREALGHLTVAFELLKTEPATAERARQEITLSCTLGTALAALHGYAAPSVERAYARARFLCHQAKTTAPLFPVLRGLWSFYIVRADFVTARELAEQLTQIAQRDNEAATLLEAHRALGYTLYLIGDLEAAHEHLLRSLDIYDPQRHGAHAFLYGQDPGVICRSHYALVLLLQGYPDQALHHSLMALALAREQRHPYTLALASYHATVLHQSLGNPQQTQELAEAMMALSQEHGFAYCLAGGMVLQGWVLTAQGQVKAGLRQMQEGIAAYETTGSAIAQPYFRALLADAHGKNGSVKKGLQCVDEAFAAVRDPAHYIHAPELYRIRGELLRGNPHLSPMRNESAESCFQQALTLAHNQGAKFFELRTLISQSQRIAPHERRNGTQQQLASVYQWFHEGADTADLRTARALLAARA